MRDINLPIMLGLLLLIIIGFTAKNFQQSPPQQLSSTVKIIEIDAIVTAYCPCIKCCEIWATKGVNSQGQRITASGHVIQQDDKFVASSPKYPFGTMVYIPGYSSDPVPVLDRCGIENNRFDVFYNDHNDALKWGRREMPVYVEVK